MRKWIRHHGLEIVLVVTLSLFLTACTASHPPTPTPPPASDGGAEEATQPPTPSPTPSPTATATATATPTLNLTATVEAQQAAATATAQAEREQAEKQLWQEIEQLQQFFKEGYSYTLEEPYQLRRESSRSKEMIIAGLMIQEFQLLQIGDKSLWDWLNEIGRLAEQAGYRMELHVDGTIYLHHDGRTKYPVHLEDWVAVTRRGKLNFRKWSIEGPGVRIMESYYSKVGTPCFLTYPAGRAKGKIYKEEGKGEHQYRLLIALKPTDIASNDNKEGLEQSREVELGAVHVSYQSYYEQNLSGGFTEKLELLPGTEIQLATP